MATASLLDALDNLSLTPANAKPTRPRTLKETIEDIAAYPRRKPHHELWYDYPALSLADHLDQVILPEPADIDNRSKPDAGSCHFDPNLSESFHNLNPTLPDIDLSSACGDEQVLNLFESIDNLRSRVGTTVLSILPFVHGGTAQFRIRQDTTVPSPDARAARTSANQWDLTAFQFELLLLLERPWVELLADIVFRKTARSYVSAEMRMMAEDVAFYARDLARWHGRWVARTPDQALQILRRHLLRADDEWAGPGCAAAVAARRFVDGRCMARLQCGCAVDLGWADFREIAAGSGENWRCIDCEEQLAWENLDGDVVDHAPQPIYPAALFVTLLTAGRSFEAPTSTISRSLQATHFEETAAALHAIHAWCVEQDKLISISPQDLRAGLELVVLQYLRQTCVPLTSQDVPTPPGWTRFLQLWLNRAVNFTTRRRCERVDLEHEGVHYHADDGLIWWSDPAPARRLPCMGDLKIDKSFEEADAMLE